jgi:hypothetical protein
LTFTYSPPSDYGTTAGSYGTSLDNAYTDSTGKLGETVQDPNTGVQVATARTVPTPNGPKTIGQLIKESRDPGNLAKIRSAMIANGLISKNTKSISTIQNTWLQVLIGAATSQQDPSSYMKALKAGGFGENVADTTPQEQRYVKEYVGSTGDAVFRKAFQDVFHRQPTAADYSSTITDANGKQLTWIEVLNNEAKKKENHTVVKRNKDGSLTTSTDPFDASTWLTGQLMNNYTKGIEAGTTEAAASTVDKYTQLAKEYGVSVVDPKTKKLYMNAAKDVAALEAGTKSLDDVAKLWKGNVLAQYSHLAPAIDAGLSLRQVADPGIKIVAKYTGKNEDLIGLDNSYVQAYLKGDGKSTLTDSALRSKILSDPNSGADKSPEVRSLLEGLSMDIKRRFGRMA